MDKRTAIEGLRLEPHPGGLTTHSPPCPTHPTRPHHTRHTHGVYAAYTVCCLVFPASRVVCACSLFALCWWSSRGKPPLHRLNAVIFVQLLMDCVCVVGYASCKVPCISPFALIGIVLLDGITGRSTTRTLKQVPQPPCPTYGDSRRNTLRCSPAPQSYHTPHTCHQRSKARVDCTWPPDWFGPPVCQSSRLLSDLGGRGSLRLLGVAWGCWWHGGHPWVSSGNGSWSLCCVSI